MLVDILISIDTKEEPMFGKKQGTVTNVCDMACRAEAIRDDALFKAAQLGPRI
jgi:hypothetical protein